MTHIVALMGDITTQNVDVIVNAANNQLAGGGGVDGAIHRAGGPEITTQCQAWVASNGDLATGEAMATTGGDLAAEWVVHTVGPIWGAVDTDTADHLLAAAYRTSLDVAKGLEAARVAFPNISTGVYGFPKPRAAQIAIATVSQWAGGSPGPVEEIRFVCFDQENFDLYQAGLPSP